MFRKKTPYLYFKMWQSKGSVPRCSQSEPCNSMIRFGHRSNFCTSRLVKPKGTSLLRTPGIGKDERSVYHDFQNAASTSISSDMRAVSILSLGSNQCCQAPTRATEWCPPLLQDGLAKITCDNFKVEEVKGDQKDGLSHVKTLEIPSLMEDHSWGFKQGIFIRQKELALTDWSLCIVTLWMSQEQTCLLMTGAEGTCLKPDTCLYDCTNIF